jgi:hypothetical protein
MPVRVPDAALVAKGGQGISRFSRVLFPCMPWISDPAESLRVSPFPTRLVLPSAPPRASALRFNSHEAQYHTYTFLYQRFAAELADSHA